MFGLLAPITYNTDINPILSHYYMGFCGGNCPPYASLFNPPWVYSGGIGVGNPYFYNNYQCGNYYPSIYAINYSAPVSFGNYYNNPFLPQQSSQYSIFSETNNMYKPSEYYMVPTQTSNYANVTVNQSVAKDTPVTNPIKGSNQTLSEQKPALGDKFVATARKYSNCSESDGSHRKFCVNSTCKFEDPFDMEWCTDFVTYVVKETYRQNGQQLPAGFGNHDVRTMKNWADRNGYFIRTSDKSQKGKFISENIKSGDIIILNENGASHTGFVTKIDKDSGIIHTIEGNRQDRVREYSYSPNYPDISGFIRLAS